MVFDIPNEYHLPKNSLFFLIHLDHLLCQELTDSKVNYSHRMQVRIQIILLQLNDRRYFYVIYFLNYLDKFEAIY